MTRRVWIGGWTLLLVLGSLAVVLLAKDNAAVERRADADAATARARTSVAALLSYAPGQLRSEIEAEKELMTEAFGTRYERLVASSLLPTAQKQKLRSLARVNGTSVVSAEEDTVSLLLFVDVATTGANSTRPKVSGSRLRVTMTPDAGSWLVSDIEPV